MLTISNWLTLSRIGVILPLVALAWWDSFEARLLALGLYLYACLTDYVDGWLARNRGEMTEFGRILDPIADKLLVVALMIMLIADGRLAGLHVIAALIILLREILISGLREQVASYNVTIPVSGLAKWKTGIQMTALGFLLVGNAITFPVNAQIIGEILLWVAAGLTFMTGASYVKIVLAKINGSEIKSKDPKSQNNKAQNTATPVSPDKTVLPD